MKLQGKTALITGASKRLGRAIALTLAKRGVTIVIHYRQSRRDAVNLKKEIEGLGELAFIVEHDFSPTRKSLKESIRIFVDAVYHEVRHVDILVNNAAMFYPTPLDRLAENEWDELMTVNLKAPFFLAREIGVRMMKQKRGKIINLVDWTGFRPNARYIPYAVSKAGLISATAGLAKALGPFVQVNSIAPGPILPAKGMTRKEAKQVASKTVLKRFGHPEDISQTVRFLCEGTDYITGALIPVDGGASVL